MTHARWRDAEWVKARDERELAGLERTILAARCPAAQRRLVVYSFQLRDNCLNETVAIDEDGLDAAAASVAEAVQIELAARHDGQPHDAVAFELVPIRFLAKDALFRVHRTNKPWEEIEERAGEGIRRSICWGSSGRVTVNDLAFAERGRWVTQGHEASYSANGCHRVIVETRSNHPRQWCDDCNPRNGQRMRRARAEARQRWGAYVDERLSFLNSLTKSSCRTEDLHP